MGYLHARRDATVEAIERDLSSLSETERLNIAFDAGIMAVAYAAIENIPRDELNAEIFEIASVKRGQQIGRA